MNISVFSGSISKGVKSPDQYMRDYNGSDYTLLECDGSDCDLDWKAVSENPFTAYDISSKLEHTRRRILEMIDKILAAGHTPVLMNLPPLDPFRFFQWITQDLDWESVYHYLDCDLTNITHWQDEYSRALTEIADLKEIPLIDIRTLFLSQADYTEFLSADGMHPNEKGHRLIEEQVASVLSPAIL